MKLNNRFVFGILSIVLAAAIAFVALPTIAKQTNGKTEIVHVTQPVPKGLAITSKDVEVVEVPLWRHRSKCLVPTDGKAHRKRERRMAVRGPD